MEIKVRMEELIECYWEIEHDSISKLYEIEIYLETCLNLEHQYGAKQAW